MNEPLIGKEIRTYSREWIADNFGPLTVESIREYYAAVGSSSEIDLMIGATFAEYLLGRIDELQSELHAGHYLVAQSYFTAPNVRPGWMICLRCKYETPALGWCHEHKMLDTCWTTEKV